MSAGETCEVVIVGAGLVGLATAIGLRKAGHKVIALDRAEAFSKVRRKLLAKVGRNIQ